MARIGGGEMARKVGDAIVRSMNDKMAGMKIFIWDDVWVDEVAAAVVIVAVADVVVVIVGVCSVAGWLITKPGLGATRPGGG